LKIGKYIYRRNPRKVSKFGPKVELKGSEYQETFKLSLL